MCMLWEPDMETAYVWQIIGYEGACGGVPRGP